MTWAIYLYQSSNFLSQLELEKNGRKLYNSDKSFYSFKENGLLLSSSKMNELNMSLV